MLKKICLGIAVVFIVFLGYVATRNGEFRYERSGVINAPAAKIFPYLSDFKKCSEWSPFEKMDPNMKKTYADSTFEFEGNRNVGSGKLERLKTVPNQLVEYKLTMTKPFHGVNFILYKLEPEGPGTRFTWTMMGESGFMGKLVSVFLNCEKMVGDQFTSGIANLKTLVETTP